MKKVLPIFLLAVVVMSGCTTRLVDFTVISTKNVQMSLDKSKGKEVNIKDLKAFGFNATIKGALDKAIEAAGPGYDMLVDGVISYSNYYFVSGYRVKGLAINSLKMKAEMGEENFNNWLRAHEPVTIENANVITE